MWVWRIQGGTAGEAALDAILSVFSGVLALLAP